MGNDQNDKKMDSVYSKRIKAGKRRTYFFDVRATRGNDYFLTITESRKRFDSEGYDRHKIFLYKEDFNKFVKGLNEAVDYVKTELMPDFDFDAFNHDEVFEDGEYVPAEQSNGVAAPVAETPTTNGLEAEVAIPVTIPAASSNGNGISLEDVDKW